MLGRAFSFVVFFIIAGLLLYGVYKVTGGDEYFHLFRTGFQYQGPFAGLGSGTTTPSSSGTGTPIKVSQTQPSRPPSQPSYTYTAPAGQQPSSQIGPQLTPPEGFSTDDLSPFYGKVRTSWVRPASLWRDDPGEFSLSADYSLEGGVDITGWRLRVNKGGEAVIPQAVEDFDPTLPSKESDITLGRGEYLYAYGTKSPLGGRNLRLNACTGYLNDIYHPAPSFPNSCPSRNRSDFANFSGRCQSFIFSLGSCEEPTPQELNKYSLANDLGCRSYLDTLNYNGCYRKYRYTANFFSNEWRAWLNQAMPFDQQHDRVLLFDRNNLLVNEYIY